MNTSAICKAMHDVAESLGATAITTSVTQLSNKIANCTLSCAYRNTSVRRGMQFELATMTEEAAVDWVRECLGAVK